MDLTEAKRILAAFETEGMEYVLVGSTAMAAQGLVRATRDLDFFVSPRADNVERLKLALKYLYDGAPNVDEISADGIRVRVATPAMLYRMKKDTVRPQDRLDAETIRREFGLDEED
jgi:hypothetical protein